MRYTRTTTITAEDGKFTRIFTITLDEEKINELAAEREFNDAKAYIDYVFEDYNEEALRDLVPDKETGVLALSYDIKVE